MPDRFSPDVGPNRCGSLWPLQVAMTQDRYMTRGRIRGEVADQLDRAVGVNDESTSTEPL